MLNTAIEAPVRDHLKKVYTALSMSTLSACAGAYVHVFTDILQSNFFTAIISVGLVIALLAVPPEPKNQNLRLSLLLGFSFFSGLSTGPLLDLAVAVDPTLVATALMLTAVVFVCFTLSALFSRNGAYLYLGGVLGSALSVFFFMQILLFFTKSVVLFQAYTYFGLVLFCAFVLYDTQSIIEKRRRGETDYIKHSLVLFLDLIDLFRTILVILLQSQDTKRKKKERD